MLIITTKVSKKKLLLGLLAAAAMILCLIFILSRQDAPQIADTPTVFENIATNEERLAFISSAGWEAATDPVSTLDLLLPSPLDERYTEYNQLQLSQGFDLTTYCGKRLTRYTYAVTNYPDIPQGVQANLYLYGTTVVAGDLFYAGEKGFTAPLFDHAK